MLYDIQPRAEMGIKMIYKVTDGFIGFNSVPFFHTLFECHTFNASVFDI